MYANEMVGELACQFSDWCQNVMKAIGRHLNDVMA